VRNRLRGTMRSEAGRGIVGGRRAPTRLALLRRLDESVAAFGLGGRHIVAAVSGGVDSTVLAWALVERASKYRMVVSIAHVHHSLRGIDADADQAFVRTLAEKLGVAFATKRVAPRSFRSAASSSRSRPTIQEAARRLRDRALREMAGTLGADRIATAHTADDQAETVLLRLLRGTSPGGLGAIAPVSSDGVVVRPLLRVSRAEVLAFGSARGLRWREDPSNADPVYARSRLRHGWLPGLREAFNPQLFRTLGDLAEAVREESLWIEQHVAREAERRFSVQPDGDQDLVLMIELDGWQPDATPDALARRLLRHALHRIGAGRDVTRRHLDRGVAFLREGRIGCSLELPGSVRLTREAFRFRLGRFRLPSGSSC
jgi:tRNA(Ile)-lysidine synthase